MNPHDHEQTEILRNIWNEMKALGHNLGSRIDQTNERLDITNQRVDITNQRLEVMHGELKREIACTNERLDVTNQRLDVTNQRLDVVIGTLRDQAAQQVMLGRYVHNAVERHDEAIADLRQRVGRLESRPPRT